MNEEMKFPKTFEEFIKQYSFFDKQQIYTNGSELIQVFRIKQWEEHKEKENQELKKQVDEYKGSHYCSFIDICKSTKIANYNQQKEFIKYLEDEIKQINPKILDDGELNLRLDDIKYTQYLTYKEILQKYKEIIGGIK